MALDIDQINQDTQTANDEISKALIKLRGFINSKISGVAYTSEQKTAIRAEFETAIRASKVAVDAVVADLDAN